MNERGAAAWVPDRKREVSKSLRAYALMTTSAARGAVRDLDQLIERHKLTSDAPTRSGSSVGSSSETSSETS